MDGSVPMDVSALKGVKISNTESRMDALAESLNSGDPVENQKNFQVPEDFNKAIEKGRTEALKFLNSEESLLTDLEEQNVRLSKLNPRDEKDQEVVNKFWRIKGTNDVNALDGKTCTTEAGNKKLQNEILEKVSEEEDEFFDDDLLGDDEYEFAEKKNYMEEDELNDAISEITGKLKLYPEADHIDYLKYLNNTEGILKRDVLMYFRGVQKNNSCSVVSRSMELISKLESVVAMSLKNSSHTNVNLKLSGEQLAKISQVQTKAVVISEKNESRPNESVTKDSKIVKPTVPKKSNQVRVAEKTNSEWKPKSKSQDVQNSQENGLKIFRNIENPQESMVVQEIPKDLNVQLVETPDLRELRVKDFAKNIGISERIIENPKAWTVLFSTLTDQVIKTVTSKDEEYQGKMKKAILSKISKAIQGHS